MASIPKEERAVILQGGGSLGAYEVGAYKAGYQFIKYRDKKIGDAGRQIFDIIAGTSIGAINSAILTSYVIENKTWEGSAEKLIDFWNYISTESIPDKFADYMMSWWGYWNKFFDVAKGETARRYYSSKEFAITGAPNVFSPPHAEPDKKFFDPLNSWYRYDNHPLKASLEKFAKFPIATSREDNQPRLLLVTVDVMESLPVVFDSYAKEDGTRKSGYGRLIVENNNGSNENQKIIGYEHEIKYPQGITSDHVIASAAVPINFDYTQIEAERYDPQTKSYKKETRYFWDGGILANTPLLQVVMAHRQYWYFGKKVKDAVPKLNVFQVNLHPARVDKVPWDHDGAVNRNSDISFGDRSKNDETVLLAFQMYSQLVKELIQLAKDHGTTQKMIDELLDRPIPVQERLEGVRATMYRDGVEGAFNIGEIIRVQRKHDDYSVSNKIFDFSSNTIKHLLQDGYNDTVDAVKARFGIEMTKESIESDKTDDSLSKTSSSMRKD
ncbi:patatin-like phospholipase family protein [Candidatus Nitrosotalea bavarica]|uniref:patatin-like phospholipase family protein n=1 Tax=Candidatus Nitrosotalea bavarica TaxID=1903277 RepID=UPI000C71444D|nr:patatin-like phospholipase family protein [Candidatus Nitrosotalea bavarica]